ncbi:DNA methyltransferase [Gracilimonas tropica]|uniref:DNA methyltransferase n=1 Tax=Gracilimonas tropica TaxID=454600 RepID=UPI00035DC24E|nr:DNA methyltransferase [Gracilimonas tropica]
MSEYLSISEAAEKLGVSKETLRRWDKSGKFKSHRHPINNYRVYTVTQIKNLVNEVETEYITTLPKRELPDPFFETNFGKLYNIDCNILFESLKPNSVDLIFADPPYNIKKAEWDTFSSQKEYVEWSMEWIEKAESVLKENGSIYICGFSEILADIKWSASKLFKGCKWLVWFYRNKANLGKDWGRSHESILHFRKSKNFKFDQDPIRIPYNKHTLKYPKRKQADSSQYSNGNGKKYVWEPHPLGAKPKDVIEIPTLSNGSWERYDHETQKPVELLKRIILSSSEEDDLVLDPFGGSGTTFAVAEALNRKWIGSELKKEYCNIIKSRVSDNEHISRIRNGDDDKDARQRRLELRG